MAKGATFALYKGTGAAKFSLMGPTLKESNGSTYVNRQGAILLEAAPSTGKQQWDWSSKITFALSIQDICNLIDRNMQADQRKRRLYHDQGKNPNSTSNASKTLEFTPGEGNYTGTFMMRLTMKEGDQSSQVTVPISNGEYQVLMRLCVGSVPQLLGWT